MKYTTSFTPFSLKIEARVFFLCNKLQYLIDGIDGKQARRIGVSGPLGEMFDHGLDSYIVFFIPFSLFSVVGRDEFSVSTFRYDPRP